MPKVVKKKYLGQVFTKRDSIRTFINTLRLLVIANVRTANNETLKKKRERPSPRLSMKSVFLCEGLRMFLPGKSK